MDKLKKYGLMEKIVHELEDLKNSQQAIITKLAKIEVDNIELGDKRLDKDVWQVLLYRHRRTNRRYDYGRSTGSS